VYHIFLHGRAWRLTSVDPLLFSDDRSGVHGGLMAPMPGRVLALLAEIETLVKKGAPLLILEAMKMEHTIVAPSAGVLKAYRFAVGDQVSCGVELVEFESAEA
jgi:3-methylcrotonyl-CoA carboxylase alpha subunit